MASVSSPAGLVAFADAATMGTTEDVNIYNGGGVCSGYQSGGGTSATATVVRTPCSRSDGVRPARWAGSSTSPALATVTTPAPAPSAAARPHFRHMQKANVVFADGHAKAVGPNTFQARLGTNDDIWHNHD